MTTFPEDLKHLRDLLAPFETCMLTTIGPGGVPRARPMSLVEVDGAADLLFAISMHSHAAQDLVRDKHALLTFQGRSHFVSVSGATTFRNDRLLIRRAWRESWRTWFPEGPEDPALSLLELTPQDVEAWDTSGMQQVKVLFEAVRAAIRGERPEPARELHERLHL
jgi:general stress protein 26